MNILIGCECSGALRGRFRDAGHNAWSCDLKPAEDGSPYHRQDDVLRAMVYSPALDAGSTYWDLIILHPECTALTVAGNHVYAAGKPKHQQRLDAIKWTEHLWRKAKMFSKRVALENPQGVLGTQSNIGKAAQYIQPYEFGENASKKTGLWLHNLQNLKPTKRVIGRFVEWPIGSGKGVERWDNQTNSGQNKLAPSPTRATERSRTYPGIAAAIVDQWAFARQEEK